METRFKEAKKVGILGIIGNVFLLSIKFCIAIVCRSQGMIADTLNSALDIFASGMTFIGTKVSEIPKDENHPFGHEKAEYIFSFVISIVMILSSITIMKGSVKSIFIYQTFEISIWLYAVCGITLIVKFIMWMYTKKIYKKHKNILILANSEDHRNDLLLTMGTIVGIVFASLGYYFVDGIMGILISAWICYVAIKLMIESVKVLMDHNMENLKLDELEKLVLKNKSVLHIDDIAAKPVGIKYMIVLKISMDGNMTLNEAHKEAGKIKRQILQNNKDEVAEVIVHVNPH